MIWLLDTNTIIYAQYVGGRVRERLDEASKRGRVVTSVLVVAELFYGAAKSSRPEANRRKVEEVIRAIEVLPHHNRQRFPFRCAQAGARVARSRQG